MARSIAALTLLLLLSGCKGKRPILDWLSSKEALSYAQYTSLERGMTLDSVREAFGPGQEPLLIEGALRGLSYPCENRKGEVYPLKLVFDGKGRLQEWALPGES
ncbi:MAG: hypothetical protein HC813_01575 [Planctomycetes bacterium]|nr:hypothetical protein [Planctomycetota bacterium]